MAIQPLKTRLSHSMSITCGGGNGQKFLSKKSAIFKRNSFILCILWLHEKSATLRYTSLFLRLFFASVSKCSASVAPIPANHISYILLHLYMFVYVSVADLECNTYSIDCKGLMCDIGPLFECSTGVLSSLRAGVSRPRAEFWGRRQGFGAEKIAGVLAPSFPVSSFQFPRKNAPGGDLTCRRQNPAVLPVAGGRLHALPGAPRRWHRRKRAAGPLKG